MRYPAVAALAGLHLSFLLVCGGLWIFWMQGGSDRLLFAWMRGPGTMLLLGSALLEFGLCLVAQAQFPPGRVMRTAWRWLAGGAFCRAAAILLNQWLPELGLAARVEGVPLAGTVAWAAHHLGGTVVLLCYLTGFALSARVLRKLHWWEPFLRRQAWLLLPAVLLAGHQFFLLLTRYRSELAEPSRWWGWAYAPLLLACVYVTLRLCLSAGCLQGGLYGAVWVCYALGMQATVLAVGGTWLFEAGYLNWLESTPLRWLLWYPVAGLLVLAPALHLEAVRVWRLAARCEASPLQTPSHPA